MLKFEHSEEMGLVDVHMDLDGLAMLMLQLRHMLHTRDHVNMKTKSWAGSELDESPPEMKGNRIVHHVRIHWREPGGR